MVTYKVTWYIWFVAHIQTQSEHNIYFHILAENLVM